MVTAILFVPYLPDRGRWINACMDYASAHHYDVVAVIADWTDASHMLNTERTADICVCARRDHLPAQRRPRLEVVAEAVPVKPPRDDQRRPRRVHRRRSVPQ